MKPNVIDSDIHADPASFDSSTAWGGNLLTGSGPYLLSDATIHVPLIPASPAGGFVIWGGLGGSGDDALIQNGVGLNATGSVAQYNAFYEYWRNAGVNVSNFSVRPGDLVEAYAYPTDDNLNWNAVGTHGCFGFSNQTQGTSTSGLCAAHNSRSGPFHGGTAEFILEPQTRNWLPDFGHFGLDGYAWAAGGRYADMGTDPFTIQQLSNAAGAATRVEVDWQADNSIALTWLSGSR